MDDIAHAKDQLIGSSVKMKGLLSTLQGFNINDYKYIGLIVSFEPTQEQLTNISKNDDARQKEFLIQMQEVLKREDIQKILKSKEINL